jgi:hypothetical protein
MKDESLWVVHIERDILGVPFHMWLFHVFSYAKGDSGVLLTSDIEIAHQYHSRTSAERAAGAYNGMAELI